MVNQIIEIDGQRWRVKAKSMQAALNEIGHARATGSVGCSTTVDSRLCSGGVELLAEVHCLDEAGDDVKPSS